MRRKNCSPVSGRFGVRKSGGRKLAKHAKRHKHLSLEPLESRNLMAVATFQQGLGGYVGAEDVILFSREPDVNFGTEASMSVDQQDANGVRQGLVKFDGIIGNMPGQIPLGAKINSATLIVNVVNDSNSAMQMSAYRMLQDWSEDTATWNSFGAIGGIQASEGEASDLPPDAIVFDPDTSANSPTAGKFDVKTTLEHWAAGEANYGWFLESAATNGWDFDTKESAQAQRPKLVVDYEVPATPQFQILNTSVFQAEGNSGTTIAHVQVARLGSTAGAASINYTITAGGPNPATAGTDFVAVTTPQALNFAAGEALATIDVAINGDTSLEGIETLQVTLSGGSIAAGRDIATVRIADDDALINEVLANVTNVSDETNREYVELIGTPNASLDGYYFVVFEGEEEENAGAGSGIADLVVNLSGQTFGDNGLLVITGNNWDYQSLMDPATHQLKLAAFDAAGGVMEDSSQTYALIRSPLTPIVQGTDYDTVGAYENGTNQAIGTGVGILDQLPAGANMVDSVGVVEGGGGDRDRVATTAERGHPGTHVHQPTPFTPGGDVASDAVSRRFGQSLPNSIGAWFNGDISNGDPVGGTIPYLEDTFFISVVAPDGAVLTPGSANLLRTVSFRVADQEKEVAEAAGSVTLRIERTGDLNEEIDVDYQTVDIGSAIEDLDYTGVQQSVHFGVGESFKDITIDVLTDDKAEGFEKFRLEITSASNASYRITNGKSSIGTGPGEPPVQNGLATVTIADANVSTKTFQNGVDGYSGTTDAFLDGEFIFDKFGQDPVIRVDQVKGEGEETGLDIVRPQQGMLRFENMFGDAINQVPMGSKIFDAFLTLNVTNTASGADIRFFRMLQDWDQVNATWVNPQGNAGGSIVNGVTPDNIEASGTPDTRVPEALTGQAGLVEIPLNVDTIQSWANGSLANFGWSIVSDSGSLWSFNSSEAFLLGTFKPELTILYTEPPAETGTFGFSVGDYTVNENGGTATITVNRVGGATGAATVDWSVAAGTADLADVTGASSGSIAFADGELFKTFSVAINNDNLLERNETLNLTLSGAGLDFDRSSAVLSIRDNDFSPTGGHLLLNEFWINSPGNDPPYEYAELIGDANIGMGSLYFVTIEGLVGEREGSAEKVVDIGAYFNGANGFSLITPDAADFGFHVPTGTTQIDRLGSIGQENLASQNDSTTYMLLYSPFTDLTQTEFDYDWDNDGALELPLGVQIVDSVGVRTFGIEDQLYGPATNRVSFAVTDPDVDAISRFRGNTQTNRGTAWFGGDLFPAGDDYLLYETAEAFLLPVTGTALTPGEANTGVAAESPLVLLTSVTPNANGTVTVNFSAPVSQVVAGDGATVSPGGSGITITDTSGVPIPTIDLRPTVSGLGTSSLTLSFSGPAVSGGQLPAGSYQLNFVGNGIIGNGRAVDVSNDGSQINGFFEFEFTTTPTLAGDYDHNNKVEQADYDFWKSHFGATSGVGLQADGNGNGVVDAGDYTIWRDHLGNMLPGAGAASTEVVAAAMAEATVEVVPDVAVSEPPLAVSSPAAAQTASIDLAFIDLAFADRRTTSLRAKAAGADAASLRTAAGGSAPFDRSLLLAARRLQQSTGPEHPEGVPCMHDGSDFSDVDSVFAQLGQLRPTRSTFRHAV